MTDVQQQPSPAFVAKIRDRSKRAIELRHNAAAEEWATSAERTVVFSVTSPNPAYEVWQAMDHDDLGELERDESEAPPKEIQTDYTMPAKPNPGLSLLYLRKARENADLAMSWLLELALGSEGYDALADELSTHEDPEEAQLVINSVMARIQTVAMGGLEGKV